MHSLHPLSLLLTAALTAAPAGPQTSAPKPSTLATNPAAATTAKPAKPEKYPLRVSVLSSSANIRYYGSSFDAGGGGGGGDESGGGGGGGDEGGGGAPAVATAPGLEPTAVFYGRGKADFITSTTARGFDFTYLTCETRVGNTLPHHALSGRWKKRNVLELLVPREDPKAKPGAKQKFDKCTVDVRMNTGVYLILPNGTLARVSLVDYIRKPALHKYSEGIEPGLIQHPNDKADPNAKPTPSLVHSPPATKPATPPTAP